MQELIKNSEAIRNKVSSFVTFVVDAIKDEGNKTVVVEISSKERDPPEPLIETSVKTTGKVGVASRVIAVADVVNAIAVVS